MPQSIHATPALVLGILSLVLQGCFVVGLLLGILGLVRSRVGFRDLASHPSLTGRGLLKAARICSITGIVLGAVQATLWLVWVVLYVTATVTDPASTGFVS